MIRFSSINSVMMRTGYAALLLLALFPEVFGAQEGVDTTSSGYKTGYQIGSWLPFLVLAGLFLIMLRAVLRKQNNNPQI